MKHGFLSVQLQINSLGYIFLSDVRNSSFMAQRTSMNLETLRYSYALEDPFWNELFYIIKFKEIKNELAQNGAGSIPIGIPISYLKAMLPVEWKSIYLLEKT